MKPRKLSKTLLAAVLMLSLLVSVFPGFGIASVADATTWDAEYVVDPNTDSAVTYKTQAAIEQDFKYYKWTYADQQAAYKDSGLTVVTAGETISGSNMWTKYDTKDYGYLDFQVSKTVQTWAITNEVETKKVDTDFEMEITMPRGGNRIGFRSIIISPEKGKFNLNGTTASGLAIAIGDGGSNYRIGFAGAIDKTTAAGTGVTAVTNKPNFSAGVLRAADATVYADIKTVGIPAAGELFTVHVKVNDGVASIWDVDRPDVVLSVKLTDSFAGGYVSFAGHDASDFDDQGTALAALKWKDVLSTAAQIQAQKDFPNVVTQNTKSTTDLTDDMKKYYEVYRWAVPCDSTVASGGDQITGDPILMTTANGADYDYPLALDQAGVTNLYDGNYDCGYLSFNRKEKSNSTMFTIGEASRRASDLDWKQNAMNFVNSFTHKRVLGADEDFYLEISAVVMNGNKESQGFMIAPAGEFAVSKTGTDKGIFVQFKNTHKLQIAGTLTENVVVENNGAQNRDTDCGPFVYLGDKAYRTNNSAGTVEYDMTAKMGSTTKDAGVQTFCVLVKDGILSLWDKDNATFVTRVELSDAYTGGVVSYVGTGFHTGAFAGLYLTTDETKFPGYDASAATYSFAFDEAAGNYSLDETQVAAADALVDLYGTGVKQNSVDGNTAGTDGAYDGGWVDASLAGAYMELKGATGVADNTNFGALVPKMTSKGGNVVSLFGSDFVADTSFRALGAFSGDNAGAKAVFGFRMAQAGNLYADGVYIEYDRTGTLEGNNELQPVTVNLYEIKDGVAGEKTQLASFTTSRNYPHFPKLHVEVTGTALTGYLQLGYEKYDLAATLTYDAAGYLATGVIGYQTYVGGMDVDLTETADYAAAANVGDGALTVNRADTDRAGYYKFIITATPDADAALKAGTLIAEDAEGQMVPKRVGFQTEETQGTQYVVYSKSDVTVAATFYKVTAGNENIAKIGTSVNTAAEGDEGYVGGGLRFVYHADIHQNAENSPYYMTVDGVEKEIADFGAIVALKSTADALNGGLCYENKDAAYVQYRSVLDSGVYYDLCDSYAQFAIQVTNISLLNVENEEITACGYILFADGTAVSTDAFTTSFAAQQ